MLCTLPSPRQLSYQPAQHKENWLEPLTALLFGIVLFCMYSLICHALCHCLSYIIQTHIDSWYPILLNTLSTHFFTFISENNIFKATQLQFLCFYMLFKGRDNWYSLYLKHINYIHPAVQKMNQTNKIGGNVLPKKAHIISTRFFVNTTSYPGEVIKPCPPRFLESQPTRLKQPSFPVARAVLCTICIRWSVGGP